MTVLLGEESGGEGVVVVGNARRLLVFVFEMTGRRCSGRGGDRSGLSRGDGGHRWTWVMERWDVARVEFAQLTRREREIGAKPVGRAHQQRQTIGGPRDVCKCSVMEVADDDQRCLLLSVVHEDGILGGDRIDHAIGEGECRGRTRSAGVLIVNLRD